jgi:magnesium transporter
VNQDTNLPRTGDDETPDYAGELSALIEQDALDTALSRARELHPAELANVLAGIDTDVRELLVGGLSAEELGAAIFYLEPHYRDNLLVGLPADKIAAILSTVPDDVATDVVQELPGDVSAEVLKAVPDRLQREIGDLLEHAEYSAGGRMTRQRIAVTADQTVGEVIQYLRSLRPDAQQPFYVYVTDDIGRLAGVLNLRSLITSAPEARVADLADTEVIAVQVDADQEETARLLKRYKLLFLPVVDRERHLLGTVTADDLLDVLEDEATEDMFRMVGVDAEEDLRSVMRSVRFRLPWLSVNLITVFAAGFVVSLFEDTLLRAAVLAAFLPMVAGMGGNAGIQTLTIVVRSLALGRLTRRNTIRVVTHEMVVGTITGTATGVMLGVVTWLWQGNPTLGIVVGLALLGNMVVGVVAGVLIPMGLQRIRQDPALSGGIWLTTATDVVGLLGFLGLATLLISRIE